ncbi:MAG TPA: ABC transporter ATP-binding protein [Acidobacteriota bacterium]|nr:ABC transporter ATP-binding protein [Acidobacteriota bacterium]
MSQFHEEAALGVIYDHRLARKLLRYLYPYRYFVVVSVVLLAAVSLLRLVGPYLVKVAIDDHILKSDFSGLQGVVFLFVLVLVGQFAVGYAQTYITNWTGQQIMADLRRQIFRHVQELDVSFFDRTPVGRIITRMTNDVDVLNELFTSGVVNIVGDLVSLLGIVGIMVWLDWRLALVTFAVIPLLFAATIIFKRKVRGTYRRVRTALARINAFLQEHLTGMSIVQVFVQENRKLKEFEQRNREHLDANLASIYYYAVYYPVVDVLGAVSIALIVWYGGGQVLQGAVQLGVLVAFVQYAERFYKPISDLSEKFNILQSAMASSERIFDLLETPVEIRSPERPAPLQQVRGEIEFRNVSFAYRADIPVLYDINLHIRPGEKIAVVGPTGSGKSTLINLLCRFYEPTQGEILLDGVDIRRIDLPTLRGALALVLQDVHLFSGTVEENIRLWMHPISREDVLEALRQVHGDRVLGRLPQGLETQVGERGSNLSTGQRQLIAFARALAHRPAVLILDEATSSVDTETELLIQDAVYRLMEHQTSIIIAHRLSTIQHCDRIVVLHKGRIREMGTHRELLARKGIYRRLYELQFAERAVGLRQAAG